MPDTAAPDPAGPDTTGPDTAAPGTAAPDTAALDTAAPGTTTPDAAGRGDAAPAEPPAPARRPNRLPNLWTALALLLVVAAAVSAGWFGWSWYAAAHDDGLAYSRTRDDVLRAGEQAVQNLNTLDYRTARQGIKVWEDSTTGDLRSQLVSGSATFLDQIAQAKTVTVAKVLDGAVTELDEHAGKASIIVAVDITVTPSTGAPTDKRERLSGQLTRTGTGWKLSAVGQVPVSAS